MSFHPSNDVGRPRCLIVQTGTAIPALRARRGDFPGWFRHGLGLPRAEVRTVRVDAGEALPAPDPQVAVIVTGSAAMVTDLLPWSEATAAWLREAVALGTPVLGVCYGHQLLAHALGGRVGDHPAGREVGTIEVECLPQATGDALFAHAPPRFRAHATHQQSVLEPPPGAVVLARSTHDACQAIRFAPHAWGMQFHPDFSAEAMQAYIRHRNGVQGGGGPARPTPVARRLLRRFGALAR